jgi:hypothetical protein
VAGPDDHRPRGPLGGGGGRACGGRACGGRGVGAGGWLLAGSLLVLGGVTCAPNRTHRSACHVSCTSASVVLHKESDAQKNRSSGRDGARRDGGCDGGVCVVECEECATWRWCVQEARLLSHSKLRICVYQSRKVWSDKMLGSALLSVSEALRRPGVPLQNTYEVVKEKNATSAAAKVHF